MVLGIVGVSAGTDDLRRQESGSTDSVMNPVAPAQGDAQLLARLSTTDYNPLNYASGTAPAMPISQIVLLGLVIMGAWIMFGKGH